VRHCNVLEWRLAGKYQFAHEERFIFSGRSCSICGWKGCNICPARQICRLNRSGGWVGGGGGGGVGGVKARGYCGTV
jgi:hypothetical protein